MTNGMSLRARDGANINGGFLVGVEPADFGSAHPLAGGGVPAPVGGGRLRPGGRRHPGTRPDRGRLPGGGGPPNLWGMWPPPTGPASPRRPWIAACRTMWRTPCGAPCPFFDRKLRGFAHPGALLTGVETRSSSPVRILRGEDCQSPVHGLYPCGEGADMRGGITSAAVDGIRVAEAVAAG